MKPHLVILCVLNYLVQTNHAEEEKQQLPTEEYDKRFDDDLFSTVYNSSDLWDEDENSAPCNVTVPGFNKLGLMIIFIVVFVFSIVGNSVVVYVVCSMKNNRASTDIYLMHLAVADLLFSLTLPFWGIEAHFGWIFGDFPCKLFSGFQEASLYTGVFLLACISVDRYVAIVRATRVLASRRLLVRVVCSAVWLVAAVLSLPVAVKRESMYAEDLGRFICYENITGESSDHWRISMRVLRHTLGFFLPLVVMTVCYSRTVVALFHRRNKQTHKAMRVILTVVLAFILCWLPYNVTVLVDTLIQGGSLAVETCETLYRVEVMLNVTQVLAFMHCAMNPVLYAFIGEKFRNQLLSALYKHGLISNAAYRRSSVNSAGSRSRNTSVSV